MAQLINKFRNILYFIIIGWILWIAELLREGRKAKQELLIKNYDLQKKDVESGAQSENIINLIDSTNKLYKPGGGNDPKN